GSGHRLRIPSLGAVVDLSAAAHSGDRKKTGVLVRRFLIVLNLARYIRRLDLECALGRARSCFLNSFLAPQSLDVFLQNLIDGGERRRLRVSLGAVGLRRVRFRFLLGGACESPQRYEGQSQSKSFHIILPFRVVILKVGAAARADVSGCAYGQSLTSARGTVKCQFTARDF